MRFLAFFHELQFSCIFNKNTCDQDNGNIFLPVSFKHPMLQIILYTDRKVRLYAGNINLNREDEKSIKKYIFLVNMPVKTCFSSPNVL